MVMSHPSASSRAQVQSYSCGLALPRVVLPISFVMYGLAFELHRTMQLMSFQEQQRMEQNIEGRMAVLQSAVGGILPPLPTAIKRAVTESTEAAIIEASESIEIAAANKPVFKPRPGMMLM